MLVPFLLTLTTLPLEPHGLECTKMHLISLFGRLTSACSLALVALLVIEVLTVMIDRDMTPLSCLSHGVLPETPNRALY